MNSREDNNSIVPDFCYKTSFKCSIGTAQVIEREKALCIRCCSESRNEAGQFL